MKTDESITEDLKVQRLKAESNSIKMTTPELRDLWPDSDDVMDGLEQLRSIEPSLVAVEVKANMYSDGSIKVTSRIYTHTGYYGPENASLKRAVAAGLGFDELTDRIHELEDQLAELRMQRADEPTPPTPPLHMFNQS